MYDYLRDTELFSERKERLLDCACVRELWHLLAISVGRQAVEVAERYADGFATVQQLHDVQARALVLADAETAQAFQGQPNSYSAYSAAAAVAWEFRDGADPLKHAADAIAWTGIVGNGPPHRREANERRRAVLRDQADLVRDVFGNPFQLLSFDARLRSIDVVALATTIYDDRAFDRLPILADALMDAGCTNDDIISHCHSPGPHVRGCWVVDLILGKQ
jgi:hypothetical protein